MSPDELGPLHTLADAIRDAWSGEGHSVNAALDQHTAFRSDRRPLSTLARNLLLQCIGRSASRCGVSAGSRGGAYEVRHRTEREELVLRVHIGRFDLEGNLVVIGPSSGELPDITTDSLWREELCVLAVCFDDDAQITDILAARVLGLTQDSVARYELTTPIPLGHGNLVPPTPGRFTPTEEDLDELEVELEEDTDGDTATGA